MCLLSTAISHFYFFLNKLLFQPYMYFSKYGLWIITWNLLEMKIFSAISTTYRNSRARDSNSDDLSDHVRSLTLWATRELLEMHIFFDPHPRSTKLEIPGIGPAICVFFFFSFSFYSYTHGIWKFQGQVSNWSCSCNLHHSRHWIQAKSVTYAAAWSNADP